MAGAEEVLALLGDSEDTEWTGLILNERGFDRALAAGLRRINLTVGSTDTFCQRNQGCTRSEAEDLVRTVGERARAESIQLTVSLAVAFGCPFEGRVAVGKVQELADIAAEAGADEIVCADTIGVAGPGAVRRLITLVAAGPIRVGGHFHDTRNTGIANCLAALDAGATLLDASVGGVGGCPFAPGATGNVGTEDLLYVLEEEGIATGIDIEAVLDCSRWLSKQLGHAASSSLSRAGVFRAGQVGASSAS